MNFAAQKAIYDSDVAAIEPDMPVTFYWQDKPYAGQISQTLESQLMMDAGYQQNFDLTIIVRYSIFPAGVDAPISESEIEIANAKGVRIRYTIKNVTDSPDGVAATFTLKSNS